MDEVLRQLAESSTSSQNAKQQDTSTTPSSVTPIGASVRFAEPEVTEGPVYSNSLPGAGNINAKGCGPLGTGNAMKEPEHPHPMDNGGPYAVLAPEGKCAPNLNVPTAPDTPNAALAIQSAAAAAAASEAADAPQRRRVVYEDALAPHERNAYSQYRTYQATKFHQSMAEGDKEVVNELLKNRELGVVRLGASGPPVPPEGIKIGDSRPDLFAPATVSPLDTTVVHDMSANHGSVTSIEKGQISEQRQPSIVDPITGRLRAYKLDLSHVDPSIGKTLPHGTARVDMLQPQVYAAPQYGLAGTTKVQTD